MRRNLQELNIPPCRCPEPVINPSTGGTTKPFCSLCGETGITFPHTCKVADINKVPDLTNRFDPYEALDGIEGLVDGEVDIWKISHHVHALRAYITGREHG